jgi:hypothetical protein
VRGRFSDFNANQQALGHPDRAEHILSIRVQQPGEPPRAVEVTTSCLHKVPDKPGAVVSGVVVSGAVSEFRCASGPVMGGA